MWFPSCRIQGQSCWGPLSVVSSPENEDNTERKAEMRDGERNRSPASSTRVLLCLKRNLPVSIDELVNTSFLKPVSTEFSVICSQQVSAYMDFQKKTTHQHFHLLD